MFIITGRNKIRPIQFCYLIVKNYISHCEQSRSIHLLISNNNIKRTFYFHIANIIGFLFFCRFIRIDLDEHNLVADFMCDLPWWYFFTNLVNNRRAILDWNIKRHLDLNFFTYFSWLVFTDRISNCSKRWNTFLSWNSCTMGDFNVVGDFYWHFVAPTLNLNLAAWSMSVKRSKRMMNAFAVTCPVSCDPWLVTCDS